jgi:hypothetical protein
MMNATKKKRRNTAAVPRGDRTDLGPLAKVIANAPDNVEIPMTITVRSAPAGQARELKVAIEDKTLSRILQRERENPKRKRRAKKR